MNNNPEAKKVNRLPRLARLICSTADAWIVGSAADPKNTNPKDFDVAVPFTEWHKVGLCIPKEARPTLFGDGWKFMSDGQKVDVWPCEVINVFLNTKCEWMWQPNRGIRIKKERRRT